MSTYNKDEFQVYLTIECHLSKLTVAAYSGDVEHFFRSHQALSKQSVQSFLKELSINEYTKRSIARKVASLKLYAYYLKHNHGQDVPVIGDIFQSNAALNLPKLIRPSTLDKVLNHDFSYSRTPCRDKCILAMLYYSGCRVSEVISLKKSNIFSDHMVILGKGGKERIMPLAHIVKCNLKAYLSEMETGTPWLFPGRKGKGITRQTVTMILSKLKKHANIKERLTPHTLRHMFATHLLSKGMDLREVQLLLGHASINTTQIYTHLDKSTLRNVFNSCHPLS